LRKGLFALGALSAAFLLTAAAGTSSRPVRVGVILKGLDNPFFVAMYEGARAESARRHVVATFRAATNLNDVAGQAKRARSLRRGRHDCYVVNPITPTNLLASFRGLKRPIVNVDSPLDSAAARRSSLRVITFIGTNDEAVGGLAAEEMKSRLHGRGEVALLDGRGHTSGSSRA
jgi:ABC-type sugar transport system substrate-binding protein